MSLALPGLSGRPGLPGRSASFPSRTALRRAVAAHRRLLAALLAGLAVLCGLTALRPPPPPTAYVLAAARDLAPGAVLDLADLRSVALPLALVPSGALRPGAPVLGRLLAGPVRRGEPLTDVRLVGPGLLTAVAPGFVAVPVRFADPGATALLRPGDRIDVLAAYPPTVDSALDPATGLGPGDDLPRTGPRTSPASVAAENVTVVAVPSAGDLTPGVGAGAGFGDGTLVVVACSPAVARALAAAAVGARLSLALRVPAGAPP